MSYPQWVILHVPHDSTEIPDSVHSQFLLNEIELAAELGRMTDHHTLALFTTPASDVQVIRAPVSRLVVDVERFINDDQEPMAARGMGAVYKVTSDLKPLRRNLSDEESASLIQEFYIPHHVRLESAVTAAIEQHGKCLIADCHSFSSRALPYEFAGDKMVRPDICIGSDEFHTSENLLSAFVNEFRNTGWRVGVNKPFSGALVPGSRYKLDARVQAVMVEVNRHLYLNETRAEPLPDFADVARKIQKCCTSAITLYTSESEFSRT